MILIYGDDSADEKRERVSSVAVVIGTEASWEAVEGRWKDRNGDIPFHAKDCESDKRDYANRSHKENKALYRDLVTMLAESKLGGFGVAVDLQAQRRIFPESLDLAYYKSFIEILDRVGEFAKFHDQIAKFTFDISMENEYNAGLLYKMCRENDEEYGEHFYHEIGFTSARESVRLQVADLVAFETMKALDHAVGPIKRRRQSWDVLRATERFEGHAYSTDWFLDLRKHYSELEKKVGFKQSDYAEWLKRKNRQHSVSNVFHFMHWKGKQQDGGE